MLTSLLSLDFLSRVRPLESDKETVRRMSQLNALSRKMKIEYGSPVRVAYYPAIHPAVTILGASHQTPQYVIHTEPTSSSEI